MDEKLMSPAAPADSPSPAVDPPASRRRGGALKRKAANFSGGNTSTPPTASSSKRQAREKPSPVLFPPIHNGPCTRARQQPNNLFPGSETTGFWDALVKSEAVPPEFAGGGTLKVEEEPGAGKKDWEALEAKIEAEYEVVKSRDVNAHIVPNHAGWFSWSRVHPLEEQTLPSFFNGKSEKRSPEIYMEIRNAIMNKFHSNPNMLIEVKDLSELSVGELDAKQEVMEFLDYWGLINYHPLPETNSTSLTVDGDKVEKADSLIHMLYHFEAEQSISPPAPRTNMSTAGVPSRLLPESVITDELARPEGTGVDYHCNSCSADCSRKRYHCQKQADFDLCSECFNGRKFDSGMSPSDFILMESAEAAGASGGKWTDQETLLLLEALELFSENWNEIAEHVATKTKAQCILHFIQMPIEDTFLDCDDEVDSSVKENEDAVATNNDNLPPEDAPETTENKDEATDEQTLSAQIEISNPVEPSEPKVDQEKGSENSAVNALKEAFKTVGTLPSSAEKLSFADSGNPVMALAAFLVRLVEPNVAIASSRSSLKFISSNESSMQLAARHSFLLEDPTDDKSSTETERDVTETVEPEGEKGMDEMQKAEKSGRDRDGTDSSKDHDKRTDKDLNTEESELLVASKKNKALVMEELGLSDSPEKDKNMDTEENDPSISPENAKDSIPEEKEQLTSSNVECTEKSFSAIKSDLMDTVQMVESSLPKDTNSLELQKEQISSIAEKDNDPSRLLGDNQSTEGPKVEEIVSDSLPSEKTEMLQPHTTTSLVGDGGNSAGEAITREHKRENNVPLNTKDDKIIYNMKRAAVTAISAAAVKAKLLADQEEDQIHQLATSLIEKQLHKLETKLAFFSEMDNVVSRVREQLERSKQKLYHERAQIIAARLGISAASSRPAAPQSLPNRAAMTFPNAMARPPMSLTPQRPPISRPMMPPGTPSSNPTAPATVTSSNQDNPAYVGMK